MATLYLEGVAANGAIWLDNTGDLIVGQISEEDGISAGDLVNIVVDGRLTVEENVLAGTRVDLTSTVSMLLAGNITASGDVALTVLDNNYR